MKKLLLSAAVAVAAVGLASFQFISKETVAAPALSSISPYELTLASPLLPIVESVDAH
jgi:hypothetical protein